MNRKNLRGLHGKTVRLRPIPRRFDSRLGWLPPVEDHWRIEAPKANAAAVRASNLATGHFIDLSSDNVFEFREPDFIVLKAQLTLTARQVLSDPLPDPRARYMAPMPRILPRRAPRPIPASSSVSPFGALVLGVGLGLAIGNLRPCRR